MTSVSSCYYLLSHLSLKPIPWGRGCYFSYFTEENIKAERISDFTSEASWYWGQMSIKYSISKTFSLNRYALLPSLWHFLYFLLNWGFCLGQRYNLNMRLLVRMWVTETHVYFGSLLHYHEPKHRVTWKE